MKEFLILWFNNTKPNISKFTLFMIITFSIILTYAVISMTYIVISKNYWLFGIFLLSVFPLKGLSDTMLHYALKDTK
jgi:cobalamin biosynthesis protein CobD/CbiB